MGLDQRSRKLAGARAVEPEAIFKTEDTYA